MAMLKLNTEVQQHDEGADNLEMEVIDKETTDSEPSIDDLPLPDADDEVGDEEVTEEAEKPKKTKKDFILERKEKQLEKQRAEAEHWRQEAEALRIKQEQLQQVQYQQPQQGAPVREDFESEDQWLDARMDWRENQKQQKYIAEKQQEAYAKSLAESKHHYEKTIERGAEKYSDFDEIVKPIFSPGFPTNEGLAQAIFRSEFGDDILVFMGKNPEHAKKIASMNPIDAIKEVAKLELRFKEKRGVKKVTASEHKPLSNIKGGSAIMTPNKIAEMPQKEFEEYYKKNFTRKAF